MGNRPRIWKPSFNMNNDPNVILGQIPFIVADVKKKIIYGTAVTDLNGIATFYITDNGLSTGNALLTSIDIVNPSVYSTNTSVINRPRVQMREKNLVGKYVSANVTNLSGVVVLGITVLGSENVMAGQTVEFMVIGSYV